MPFILAAEQLMEVEAPPRAMWIRTILFELSRIANVSLFIGDLALQLGAQTPAFYAFRDREFVLNQIESVTGGRFHPNFDRIGGLKDDLPKGWIAETKAAMVRLRGFCDQMEGLVYGNEIFQSRTRGIGIVPAHVALSYGLSGANLRGSGVDWDLRRDANVGPRLRPARLEGVDPPRRRQLLPLLGAPAGGPRGHPHRRPALRRPARPGRSWPRCPASSRCPRARPTSPPRTPSAPWATTSCPRATPARSAVKIRSASFNNISVASWLLQGVYVPDIITILASLYFILGDIDR